jgi:hypothetical protein
VVSVLPAALTTTSIISSANPSKSGSKVTFTATVISTSGMPTGTVLFFDGTRKIGSGILSGNISTFATLSLTNGLHNITAVYNGDINYKGSTSTVLVQRVIFNGLIRRLYLFPNPVTDGIIYLQMKNLPQGNYVIIVYNELGEKVLTQHLTAQGNSIEKIRLEQKIKGVYNLEVVKPDNTRSSHKIIVL